MTRTPPPSDERSVRLLVVDEPLGGKFFDLEMLLIPGVEERTEEEYRALFVQAASSSLTNRIAMMYIEGR